MFLQDWLNLLPTVAFLSAGVIAYAASRRAPLARRMLIVVAVLSLTGAGLSALVSTMGSAVPVYLLAAGVSLGFLSLGHR